MSNPRRAYVCMDAKSKVIHLRKFLLPGEKVPSCPDHGLMRPQVNNRYRGKVV